VTYVLSVSLNNSAKCPKAGQEHESSTKPEPVTGD